MKKELKTVLAIGGLDPSSGAGIAADSRAILLNDAWPLTVATAITFQNPSGVRGYEAVAPKVVEKQIRSVYEKKTCGCVKTGMLGDQAVAKTVAGFLEKQKKPLVVDPILWSGTGKRLLDEKGQKVLEKKIFPLATLLTPNRREAEEFSNTRIRSEKNAWEACEKILETGAGSVLLKGGHLGSDSARDYFFDGKNHLVYEEKKTVFERIHGAGCFLASSIAAQIANGKSLKEAIGLAKKNTHLFITRSVKIGKGARIPLDYGKQKQKTILLARLGKAVELLTGSENFAKLVPEVGSNLAEALPDATDSSRIAAVPGRITLVRGKARNYEPPEFGVSSHVANCLLAAKKKDPSINACLNIRFSEKMLSAAKKLGFSASGFDRAREPESKKEGRTLPWGVSEAIRKNSGKVPDLVYDKGGVGKEAMIRIFAKDSEKAAQKAVRIANGLRKGD